MHACRLVELAVSAASLHKPLVDQRVAAESWRADEFWVLSRARVNEWSRLMKECEQARDSRDYQPRLFWRATSPILDEVFLSEICTRLWCATLAIIDEKRLHGELAPIARSVFVASLEVRRRALRLLLFAQGLPGISATAANLLRRNCEVWTDGLLAQLSPCRVAQQFSFDRRRVQRLVVPTPQPSPTQWVSTASLHAFSINYGLATQKLSDPVCDELNSELAANLLSCLPPNGFNGCGEPCLTWSTDSFSSDMLSISVLEDLCGNSIRPRYDVPGSLKDRL